MGDSSDVPALRRGLAVLRLVATKAGPVTAAAVARELGLPRSTTYHLLAELVAAGFVTHLPEERRYGLGVAAFEVGSAFLRHDPLQRLGRPVLARLARRTGNVAHLGVLHGAETLYVAREKPPRTQTVTDVGVRISAHLTASGRAVLAHVPAAQVRALFPGRGSFVGRTGRGPGDLPGLRALLAGERARGWAVEDGFVTEGFASVAAAVRDHNGSAVAAVSTTFRHGCADPGCGETWPGLARATTEAAGELSRRIGGTGA
ncbi:IclR family transcriptional regulator [Actinokineospora sp. G85]|uniref:IclR family transcriptional regulator n=1 Tax=Actinokineospora sp. G85 TaxID=3406626 RepID=UPI003C76FF24